jgi:hypothetical protein
MSEETPDPELTELERALAGLTPAPGQFDRDRLMFRAGQASAPRRGWVWPSATAAFAVLAAVLGVALVNRPTPATIERTVYVEVPAPMPPVAPPAPLSPADTGPVAAAGREPSHEQTDAARLRNQVLRWGVDALPSPPPVVVSQHGTSVRRLLGEIEQ